MQPPSFVKGGDAVAGGGEDLGKTMDLRMRDPIFSTRVPASPPPSGERKTIDRRTDPSMSCIGASGESLILEI